MNGNIFCLLCSPVEEDLVVVGWVNIELILYTCNCTIPLYLTPSGRRFQWLMDFSIWPVLFYSLPFLVRVQLARVLMNIFCCLTVLLRSRARFCCPMRMTNTVYSVRDARQCVLCVCVANILSTLFAWVLYFTTGLTSYSMLKVIGYSMKRATSTLYCIDKTVSYADPKIIVNCTALTHWLLWNHDAICLTSTVATRSFVTSP